MRLIPPDYDSRSDAELVDAANAGDEAAFAALYARHRDWVARLARRFTGDADDALDVLQETFVYLLGKLPALALTASLTTFLYPAVKNLSLALLRKKRRSLADDRLLADVPAPPPAPGAGRAELAAVFAALPFAQREVVLMRFVDGLSLADIAAALQLPTGTVKSRLHNALEALRADSRTRRYFGECGP